MKKLICALLVMALSVGIFAGCDLLEADPKTFTYGELSITLNDDFKEADDDQGYDVVYESRTAVAFLVEESFEDLGEELTLEEYVEFSLQANEREDLEIKEQDGYLYVEYTDEVEGEDYYYMVAFYEGNEAFWLVNFTTSQENKSKLSSSFEKWAASVEFN